MATMDPDEIESNQLLWVNCTQAGKVEIGSLAAKLKITPRLLELAQFDRQEQRIDRYEGHFTFALDSFAGERTADLNRPLHEVRFIVGERWLVTLADTQIDCIAAFRRQDKGESQVGMLTPPTLLASLLDSHLGQFFGIVSKIEERIDTLDERIVKQPKTQDVLVEIVAMRRSISKLRSALAQQRAVFYGLGRPDFAILTGPDAERPLAALAARFDRALDEVERSRDVLIGSFDLFSSITANQTNELVKALTFVTVVLGLLGAIAGVMGMNFPDMAFFKTGAMGFEETIATMGVVVILSILVARWRTWI